MDKLTIGVESLSSCEGCSLVVLECEAELLDILQYVEVKSFREAMTERDDNVDIMFVDGAVTSPQDEEELREYRAKCKTLVAIGACACMGGLYALKNPQGKDVYAKRVYGEHADWYPTQDAMPLDAFVKVDLKIRGCPMSKPEFLEVVKSLVVGRTPHIPDYPVCAECKLRENACLWHKGEVCLGPIARAGCQAICPSYGGRCWACRGFISEPNKNAAKDVMEEFGLTVEDIKRQFMLANTVSETANTIFSDKK